MIKTRKKNSDKRKQMLNVATQLFTERGYAAITMGLIAKLANVSKQTVYSHFGNKEALFSAAITQKCSENQFDVLSQIDLSNPPEALLSIAKNLFEVISSKESLAVHKICVFEAKSYPQLSELFFPAGPLRVIEEITELMARINLLAEYQIENPHFAAIQFINIIKGEAWCRLELNLKQQLTEQEIAEYLQNSVNFFIKGYRI